MKEITNKQILTALRLEVAELTSIVKELRKEQIQAKKEITSDVAVGKILLATFVPKLNKQIKITSDVEISEENRSSLVTQAVTNYEGLFLDDTEIVISSGHTFVKNKDKVLQINTKNKELKSTMLSSIYLDTSSNEVIVEFKKTGQRYKYYPNNLTTREWNRKVSELMDSDSISKFFRNEFIRKDHLIAFQKL